MDRMAYTHYYPSTEWFKAVSEAIGFSPEVIKSLIDSWHLLGKTPKQMEERLKILAQQNGKSLNFPVHHVPQTT